ncbi:MAG TPA: hypothetical protein VEC16_05880, partial [Alphaproteobacteria bacterium]|nr:hypothetical protein [Alphaproteobacteria bacterium]
MSFKGEVRLIRIIQSLMLFVLLVGISAGIASAAIIVKSIENTGGISYRAVNDSIGVNATSTSNLSINNKPCISQGNNVYICTITDKANSATASYQLTNAEGNSLTTNIKVDNSIAAVSYTLRNTQGKATLDYIITDSGFNLNSLCSGIKTLVVYEGESEINNVNINGTPGSCYYNGSITLSISSSGTKSIRLKAIDNVGNVHITPAQNISVDIQAPEIINGLVIKYAGTTSEITTISSSASFLVDLYFSVREENIASIIVNMTSINNNPAFQYVYKNFNVPLGNCIVSNTTISTDRKVYDCVIRSVSMKLSSGTVSIAVSVNDTYGSNTTSTLTKLVTIDNVIPQVSIKTDKCDGARCYIHDGVNNILISLNKENFEKKMVFYTISGSSPATNRVLNCTGGECVGTAFISCSSGSQVDVSISSTGGFVSRDDSGNQIAPYNTYFYCDNTVPDIESINVTGQTSSVIRELVSGSNIKIEAKVKEAEANELTAQAYLEKIKNATEEGECARIDNTYFNCVWNINNINSGYYDAEISINATDIVGNTDEMKHAVRVFGFKSDNETPDNLAISLLKVYPTGINRIVLDMATTNGIPFYVYATYDLSVVKGNDIDVLYQQLDLSKCSYISDDGTVPASIVFLNAKISNEYANLDDVSRIDFTFHENTDPNVLADEFEIECNISAIVKEGDYIYKNPQQLALRIPFKLSNTKLCNEGQDCTPGERIGKKIADAEDNFLVRAEILGTVGSIIPKIQKICDLRGYVTQGAAGAQILSMAANAVSIGTQNVEIGKVPISIYMRLSNLDACFSGSARAGSGMHGTDFSNNLAAQDYANNALQNPAVSGTVGQNQNPEQNARALAGIFGNNPEARAKIANTCGKFVEDACDFLSCAATDEAQKIADEELAQQKAAREEEAKAAGGKGAFARQTEAVLTKNLDKSDYRNSAVMAAAEGCWPAVLYNVNKWRQSECNYVYCLKMAAYSGTDVSACEAAKKTQTCSLIVGEVFEMPGARYIKNLAENAADYVKNFFPLAASSLMHKQLCPEYVDADSVLSGEKIDPPNTIGEQTLKIYGCQLPLQLARLADSNMRSNFRGHGNFVYPEMPDMCRYAECVGEENCEYEPDFWDTLNKMRIVAPKNSQNQNNINQDRNTEMARISSDQKKLSALYSYSRKFSISEERNNKGQQAIATQADVTEYNKLLGEFHQKGQLMDVKAIRVVETYERPDGGWNIVRYEEGKIVSGEIPEDGKLIATKYDDSDRTINRLITTDEQAIRKYHSDLNLCKRLYASSSPTQVTNVNCNEVLKYVDKSITDQNALNSLNIDPQSEDFKKLDIVEQNQQYVLASNTMKELDDLDRVMGVGFGSLCANKDILVGPGYNCGELNDKRNKYYGALGLCDGDTGISCTEYSENLALAKDGDPILEDYKKLKTTKSTEIHTNMALYQKEIRRYRQAEQFGNSVYIALQYLNAQKMLEWMYSDYWTEKWFGDKFSNYVDPTKWKESLCNPTNPINVGGTSSDGTVISCSSGQCRPVLTYTAERTLLEYPNGTKYYIYTVVYYISGGDLRGRPDTKYNVYVRGEGQEIKGYKDDLKLQSFDTVQNKTAFISPNKYNEICIQFTEPFPPDNSLENALTYCRKIVENGFNTGSPWSPEEENAGAGYTNQYDQNGNRIRN